MGRVRPSIVTSTFGSSRRLSNHFGWRSWPPFEATTTMRSPSWTGDVNIVVRRLPVLRPAVVSCSTGIPFPRFASRPLLTWKTARWKPVTARMIMSLALAMRRTSSGWDRPEQHLLGDGDGDVPIGAVHRPSQHAPTARVHEGMHVVEEPLVGSQRTMEPRRVVDAHHAGDVTLQVERAAAGTGDVGDERDERGVEVRVVGQRDWDARPRAMRRRSRAVRRRRGRPQASCDPRSRPDGRRHLVRPRAVTVGPYRHELDRLLDDRLDVELGLGHVREVTPAQSLVTR